MISKDLKEKNFNLKGMFLELKELMQLNEFKFIGLGIYHSIIHFDDFKLEIHSKELDEMLLRLYYLNSEIACINVLKEDSFMFYFDEVTVDFIDTEIRKVN